MNDDTTAVLQGQLFAHNLVLMSLLQTIGPVQAAETALILKMALEDEKQRDEPHARPDLQVDHRDQLTEAFLDLLRTISQRR